MDNKKKKMEQACELITKYRHSVKYAAAETYLHACSIYIEPWYINWKRNNPFVPLNVKIDLALHKRMSEFAKKNDMSHIFLVESAIREFLDKETI